VCGHTFVGTNAHETSDPIYISDENYKYVFDNLDIVKHKNVLVPSNLDILYSGIRAADLAVEMMPLTLTLSPNDILVHVRLDDFIHSGHNSEILDISYYVRALKNPSNWDRVIIVTDVLRTKEEQNYIDVLKETIGGNIVVHQGFLLQDWHMLRSARNIVLSNSTFAWTALLAGNAEYAVVPNTKIHAHQVVCAIKDISVCVIIDT
jgi:hypothetical protein